MVTTNANGSVTVPRSNTCTQYRPGSTEPTTCVLDPSEALIDVARLHGGPAPVIPRPSPTVKAGGPTLVSVAVIVPAVVTLNACEVAPRIPNTLEKLSAVGPVAAAVVRLVVGDVVVWLLHDALSPTSNATITEVFSRIRISGVDDSNDEAHGARQGALVVELHAVNARAGRGGDLGGESGPGAQ